MDFGSLDFGVLTPAALLGLAVLSVIRGWLVPRMTHRDTLADRDHWRTAHEVSERARAEQAEQLARLLDQMRAVEAATASLLSLARTRDRQET